MFQLGFNAQYLIEAGGQIVFRNDSDRLPFALAVSRHVIAERLRESLQTVSYYGALHVQPASTAMTVPVRILFSSEASQATVLPISSMVISRS